MKTAHLKKPSSRPVIKVKHLKGRVYQAAAPDKTS